MSQALQNLTKELKKAGYSKKEIAGLIAFLMQQSSLNLYTRTMGELSDGQLARLEKEKDRAKAEKMIADFYQKQTGKSFGQAIEEYLQVFSQGFLREYKKKKKAN